MSKHTPTELKSLPSMILTVSDTRNEQTDTSGLYLKNALEEAGHKVLEKEIVSDDIYQIRKIISNGIASEKISVILVTGGTGLTDRDVTCQAIMPLLDKSIDGFGELFRAISYQEIGQPGIQSRAFAGLANNTVIFALPGSTNAVKTAFKIIEKELNSAEGYCTLTRNLDLAGVEE